MRFTAATGSAALLRTARELVVELLIADEVAHPFAVERDRGDDDVMLGEVAAEGSGTDAGGPQQLRGAERVRGDDHDVGGDGVAVSRCGGRRRARRSPAPVDARCAARTRGPAA